MTDTHRHRGALAQVAITSQGEPWTTEITIDGQSLLVSRYEVSSGPPWLQPRLVIDVGARNALRFRGRLYTSDPASYAAWGQWIGQPGAQGTPIRIEFHDRISGVWADEEPLLYLQAVGIVGDAADGTTTVRLTGWPNGARPTETPPLVVSGELVREDLYP